MVELSTSRAAVVANQSIFDNVHFIIAAVIAARTICRVWVYAPIVIVVLIWQRTNAICCRCRRWRVHFCFVEHIEAICIICHAMFSVANYRRRSVCCRGGLLTAWLLLCGHFCIVSWIVGVFTHKSDMWAQKQDENKVSWRTYECPDMRERKPTSSVDRRHVEVKLASNQGNVHLSSLFSTQYLTSWSSSRRHCSDLLSWLHLQR